MEIRGAKLIMMDLIDYKDVTGQKICGIKKFHIRRVGTAMSLETCEV